MEGLGAALASARRAEADSISVGDLVAVKLGSVRFEAVVEDQHPEQGLHVLLDGPTQSHALIGSSVWVPTNQAKKLPMPKEGVVPADSYIGASVICHQHNALVLDVRQGVKHGSNGLRFKLFFLHSGQRDWVRASDVYPCLLYTSPSPRD